MTALWTSDALSSATGGTASRPFTATGVSIDSRTVQPGDLFVALVGSTDGHAHVADALKRGAAGAVVHDMSGLDSAPLLVGLTTCTARRASRVAESVATKSSCWAALGSLVIWSTARMFTSTLRSRNTLASCAR